MPKLRHEAVLLDRRAVSGAQITTLIYEYPHGYRVPLHFHDRDQLVFATQGVMSVQTSEGAWVVPSQRAVWIPAQVPHEIRMAGKVSMRTLYLKPGLAPLSRSCCVMNVSPLLRELIVHCCQHAVLSRRRKTQAHLIDCILDQLATSATVPLQLPNPLDPRARKVAEMLVSDAAKRRPLQEFCRSAGASKRTIERIFQRETGMSLGKWRQQLRIMQAVRLLAAGEKVSHVALEAGYSAPGAFAAMFRKLMGTTPGKYFN